jgi:proline dehydrogenase
MKNASLLLKQAKEFESQTKIDKQFFQNKIEELNFNSDQLEEVRKTVSSLKEKYNPNKIDNLIKGILFAYDDKESILEMILALNNTKMVERFLES